MFSTSDALLRNLRFKNPLLKSWEKPKNIGPPEDELAPTPSLRKKIVFVEKKLVLGKFWFELKEMVKKVRKKVEILFNLKINKPFKAKKYEIIVFLFDLFAISKLPYNSKLRT